MAKQRAAKPAYQRNPPYCYPDLEKLKEDRPYDKGLSRPNPDEKMSRFGDPTDLDFEKDRIVEVELAGFGPDGRRTAKAKVHRDLADVLRRAFDEIASLGLSYRLNTFGPHSTYSFRYGTGRSNFKRFTTSGEYAGVAGKETWNVVYARHDRAHHRMQKPVGSDSVPRWRRLSNHAWGSAIDINAATNPMGALKEFDLPPEIVRVMRSWGYYWGGYFLGDDRDYMHFEFASKDIRKSTTVQIPRSHVVFPFGQPGKHESPTKYFFLNEQCCSPSPSPTCTSSPVSRSTSCGWCTGATSPR